MAVQKKSEGSPTPAVESEESEPAILHRNDFVPLNDDIKRIEDISLLEAHQNFTIAHFPNGKLLIRRSLKDCEGMLDSSIFFRASRDCIVNLSQVKQPRLSKDRGLIFLLKEGKRSCFLAGKPLSSVKHAVSSSGTAGTSERLDRDSHA